MLQFIAQWLSGNQRQTLANSLAAFIGENPAYTSDDLCSDLHRFVFLLGASDGQELFQRPNMIDNDAYERGPLDRITRITPIPRGHGGD